MLKAATTLAKQLVNLRKQKAKNMNVSSRVMAIGHQTQAMHSTAKMAGAMSTASKVHVWLNTKLNTNHSLKCFFTHSGLHCWPGLCVVNK